MSSGKSTTSPTPATKDAPAAAVRAAGGIERATPRRERAAGAKSMSFRVRGS